jgi:hypothetical protein
MKLACALMFGAAVGTCQAAEPKQVCSDDTFTAVGEHFKISNFKMTGVEDGVVLAAACKSFPGDPMLEIAVFAYDAGEANEKQQLVALVNHDTGKIVSSNVSSISEDALVSVDGATFWIDTARYQLAPGVRAFGVDFRSGYNPHYCPESGEGAVRELFVREGRRLRLVLAGLVMSSWRYVEGSFEGCADVSEERPYPATEHSERFLTVLKSKRMGYADLQLTTQISFDNSIKPAQQSNKVLRYDGKRYPLRAE